MKFIKSGITILLLVMMTGCQNKAAMDKVDSGMTAIESADYEKAVQLFDEALAEEEDNFLALRGKGIAYLEQKDYENAVLNLEKVLQKLEGKDKKLEKDISYYLAAAKFGNADYDGAIQIYTARLEKEPKETDSFYLRGEAYLAIGETDKAKADFEEALNLGDQSSMVLNIYSSLEKAGMEEEGKKYLTKAVENGKYKKDALEEGKIYYFLGEWDKASEALDKARGKGKDEALLYLGMVKIKEEDTKAALSYYEAYLKKHQDSGKAYNLIGLCKMEEKDYANALQNFQKGIEMQDEESLQELMYNEITAYEYLTDFTTAKAKMEQYLVQYQGDDDALREYEFLKTRK